MESYSRNRTYDNKWHIPDNVDTIEEIGRCSYNTSVQEILGLYSCQHSFGDYLSLAPGAKEYLWDNRLTGNTLCKNIESGLVIALIAAARCEMYKVTLLPSFTLSENFTNSVMSLPTELNSESHEEFQNFVDSYGTHFTTEITMGGK